MLEKEIEQRQQTEVILSQSQNLLGSVLNSSRDVISAWKAVRDVNGAITDFSCLIVNPVLAEAKKKRRLQRQPDAEKIAHSIRCKTVR